MKHLIESPDVYYISVIKDKGAVNGSRIGDNSEQYGQ